MADEETGKPSRAERQAKALRENLRRRKTQSRERVRQAEHPADEDDTCGS